MNIYYAHSKLHYNTQFEKDVIAFIKETYPMDRVIDPNKDIGELGSMHPYLKVVDSCDVVIATTYNKFIGKGVYEEVKRALELNKTVLLYDNKSLLPIDKVTIHNPNDWKFRYATVTAKAKEELMSNLLQLKLRKRISLKDFLRTYGLKIEVRDTVDPSGIVYIAELKSSTDNLLHNSIKVESLRSVREAINNLCAYLSLLDTLVINKGKHNLETLVDLSTLYVKPLKWYQPLP